MKPSNTLKIGFSIFVGLLLLGCGSNPNGLDADVESVSQPADLTSLTYTVRVTGLGNCDATGVEVDLSIPISLSSALSPGETLTRTHKVGRVKKDKKKKKTFTIDTNGALIETDSIKAEVSDIDGTTACNGLF